MCLKAEIFEPHRTAQKSNEATTTDTTTMLPSHVNYINLKNRPDRNEVFLKLNSGIIPLERVEAVVGKDLAVADLIREQIIQEPLRFFSPGALGNALSHKKLWDPAVQRGTAVTVAEDDAILNRHFARKADDTLQRLPQDWDIILWGWNFDSILDVELLPNLKHGVMMFDSKMLGPRVVDFQEAEYDVVPLRLRGAFGIVCYSLSATGAKHLLERCFPLKNELISIPGLSRQIQNFTLDACLNKHFPALQAYACFPPLAYTENDKTNSDVMPVRSA
jgi:GR25 family glycosyltransferase involved in LPS biosynthesis